APDRAGAIEDGFDAGEVDRLCQWLTSFCRGAGSPASRFLPSSKRCSVRIKISTSSWSNACTTWPSNDNVLYHLYGQQI
ncbi:hypothetical protein, partial [Pseudomonas asplenii]|uniref:hypothetical protein n=1 Tax=Pseudomonas asplenii TaxID=53407 RepID=UPI0019557157